MTLLEILLLLFVAYWLLKAGRGKQPEKSQPERNSSKCDLALEEVLREIRAALGDSMRRPAPA